jgi:hypothetical protein
MSDETDDLTPQEQARMLWLEAAERMAEALQLRREGKSLEAEMDALADQVKSLVDRGEMPGLTDSLREEWHESNARYDEGVEEFRRLTGQALALAEAAKERDPSPVPEVEKFAKVMSEPAASMKGVKR